MIFENFGFCDFSDFFSSDYLFILGSFGPMGRANGPGPMGQGPWAGPMGPGLGPGGRGSGRLETGGVGGRSPPTHFCCIFLNNFVRACRRPFKGGIGE